MTTTRPRRLRLGLLAGAAAATALAVPAEAAPPQPAAVPFVYGDFDNGYAVFINIDRPSYCTPQVVQWELDVLDWLEGGEVGPPPPEPEYPEGFAANAVEIETGSGAAVGRASAEVYVEMWPFDDDAPGIGPCLDTDGSERFAHGTALHRANDNDIVDSGTRARAVSERGHALVEDTEGQQYSYEWRFHVNSRCPAAPMAPPRCLTSSASLTAL